MQVIETGNQHMTSLSLASKLLQNNIIMVSDTLDRDTITEYQEQLLYLASRCAPGDTISMYINSPGGSVYDGLGLYDLMQYIQTKGIKIRTVNIGQACSMAFILLIGGTKGCRESLPNCSAMIHELSSGDFGTTSQFEDTAKEMRRVQTILNEIITKHSNAELIELCKRKDFWLSAEEALKYNVIDKIL